MTDSVLQIKFNDICITKYFRKTINQFFAYHLDLYKTS